MANITVGDLIKKAFTQIFPRTISNHQTKSSSLLIYNPHKDEVKTITVEELAKLIKNYDV